MILPGVIFDMDGLLLDTEKVCLESFVETRRIFALSDSPDTFLRCVGLRGQEPARIIGDSLGDNVSFDDFSREWDRRIDAALGREIPAKPGALQLVQMLADKGYSLAVATSTETDRACQQLGSSGFLEHFECVIGGDKVIRHKPDPEVYYKAADRLGYQARNCIAFEDSETGTRAAIASGAQTVQVPDLIAPSDELHAMGHVIASGIIEGAIAVALLPRKTYPEGLRSPALRTPDWKTMLHVATKDRFREAATQR
ncbi:HAD family hydrolase [Qingshengfaniella alkalisoli]|uniref:HAD family phosphatase n=1 Tax=Qingshengfaniella alkalisoli TaxID=2599296 RepID=A0A5B8J4F1_9RHOB|nr:HAD family phosphatase [Qingshengfaniella alkalisoli]QDY69407.1 HAD family phosphatase [Qingshengfaniella alkalisoli]